MKYAPETQEKFDQYAQILRIWQTRMNLVAPSTLNDVQTRHIDDSTQMAEYLPNDAKNYRPGQRGGIPCCGFGNHGMASCCNRICWEKNRIFAKS